MNRRAFGLLALSLGLAFQLKADRFPYRAKVVAIEDLTPDTKRISFRLVDGEKFQFIPGQYVFLKVPEEYVKRWNERYKTTHDEVARPYSFAGSPRRLPTFDLIIKLAGAPPV